MTYFVRAAIRISCALACVCYLGLGHPFPARAADLPPIDIEPGEGRNLSITEQISPERLIVELTTPTHNWFAGTFRQLPTDREVTIGLSLPAIVVGTNSASVKKWEGLSPMMTYADPLRYESFECFQKDVRGRWVSEDLFKAGDARFAGTGKTPTQDALPGDIADKFLSADGKFWCPWREVDATEVAVSLNIFRIRQQFAVPQATVAMRIPYTYTYLQAFLTRLQAAKLPGVTVHEIGMTGGKRKLQVIQVDDPSPAARVEDCKTILVVAREHATEHASSWALHGMLTTVLRDAAAGNPLRRNITWLFVPILDPDGSAESAFDRLTSLMKSQDSQFTPEALAYARFLSDYYYAGHTLDMAVSLHNLEAGEGENLLCPHAHRDLADMSAKFNGGLFETARQQGYRTGNPDNPWEIGPPMIFRLYGWCAELYNAFDLSYEVNDRYPPNRLSLLPLQRLGGILAGRLATWCASDDGNTRHQQVARLRKLKVLERAAYFQNAGHGPEQRTPIELIIHGY